MRAGGLIQFGECDFLHTNDARRIFVLDSRCGLISGVLRGCLGNGLRRIGERLVRHAGMEIRMGRSRRHSVVGAE